MYLMRLIEHTNDSLCNIMLSQGSYGFTDLRKYYIHIGVYRGIKYTANIYDRITMELKILYILSWL